MIVHILQSYYNFSDLPPGLIFGCGITAYDYADAISLLEIKVFKGKVIPELRIKKESINIQTLDKGHIIPNMKEPTQRGVWYPIGYE